MVFLAVVVTASAQAHPAPAFGGIGLAVTLVLVMYAAAVLAAVSAVRGSGITVAGRDRTTLTSASLVWQPTAMGPVA